MVLETNVGYSYRQPARIRTHLAQRPRSEETYQSVGYFWRTGAALRLGPRAGSWMGSLGLHYAEAYYREKMQLRTTSVARCDTDDALS